MPPKASVGVGAAGAASQEQLLSGLRTFLENQRPPLSVNGYEAMIPRHTVGPHWTAQDEDDLRAEGRFADILRRGPEMWKHEGARQLWRLFPRLYRCLPTDLFSWTYQVDADTGSNPNVSDGPFTGARNVVWSKRYCNEVMAFTMHGFWTYKREWDFPVMAQLMQLAVICRKNDCRRWRIVNRTRDAFLTELANELQVQNAGVRTIKEIVDVVNARMDADDMRPTEFQLLCSDIVAELFRPTAGPLLVGTPGPYKVNLDDLKGLVKCLDRLAPTRERTGLATGWTGEQWKQNMEKARGSGRGQGVVLPTKDDDLLARAIAFGLMARERDEKIAGRAAQAADGNDDGGLAADDEEPQSGEPPVETELEKKARLDKEALDEWSALIKARDEFAAKSSPSPTRGRINRGPRVLDNDDYAEFWGIDRE